MKTGRQSFTGKWVSDTDGLTCRRNTGSIAQYSRQGSWPCTDLTCNESEMLQHSVTS